MSFNRGGRGGNRGGGFRGGRGGGGNRFGSRGFDQGPPDRVIPLGQYSYICEDDLVCKVEIEDVPYFNAPIYLENKEPIGKIDEIFGTIREFSVTVKLSENMNANSFKPQQKLFIDPAKLLPISRFLPKPPQKKGAKRKGLDGGMGGGRGNSRDGGFGRGRGSGSGRRGGFIGGRGGGGGGFKRGGAGGGGGRGGGGRGGGGRGGGRGRW